MPVYESDHTVFLKNDFKTLPTLPLNLHTFQSLGYWKWNKPDMGYTVSEKVGTMSLLPTPSRTPLYSGILNTAAVNSIKCLYIMEGAVISYADVWLLMS